MSFKEELPSMELNKYQKEAKKTAVWPSIFGIIYPTLALSGEAGEFSEQVKKMLRDDGAVITPERRERMIAELGDILWYISAIADELNVNLDDVATENLQKLENRKTRDKIHGDGSNR